jgi:aminopeptidase N
MTADIPASWESVSDGNPVSTETKGARKLQSWSNPFASDGNMFMAAPFVVKMTTVDSVAVACYFFEADTGLFESYLPATAGYIRMYSDLIGPYPFKRFSVVENFFPTGYGMPGWTLLGQQVIRLPFIVFTSLGHEVLHNWWGNSVYVDYERGNWCEGLTVYGADYRYKLQKSPDDARD